MPIKLSFSPNSPSSGRGPPPFPPSLSFVVFELFNVFSSEKILLNATYALDASTASVDAEPTSIPLAKTEAPPFVVFPDDDDAEEEEYTAREMEIVPSERTVASAVAVSWCMCRRRRLRVFSLSLSLSLLSL